MRSLVVAAALLTLVLLMILATREDRPLVGVEREAAAGDGLGSGSPAAAGGEAERAPAREARFEDPVRDLAPSDGTVDAGEGAVLVRFRVIDADGAPVPGCEVLCQSGQAFGREFFLAGEAEGTTDAEGSVELSLERDEPRFPAGKAELRAQARSGEKRATPIRRLAYPPGPGPHELAFSAGSGLRVRVVQRPEGPPVEGAEVHVRPVEVLDEKRFSVHAKTDELGEHTFEELPAGEYSWYAGAPHSEHNLRGRVVVAPGTREELFVVLSSDEIALAVAGVFLDELGQPAHGVSLWVGESRARGELVYPDVSGRFALYREPTAEVFVALSERVDADRYAPDALSVPFGTTDLVFRVVERFPRKTSRFRVVDAETRAPVHGASVALFFEDAWQSREVNSARPGEDDVWMEYAARPGLRWIASAPGYEVATGFVGAEEIVVELKQGDAVELQVLDALDGSPLERVRFLDGYGTELAVSGEDGRLVLRDARAAGRLRVERAGYLPRPWYASWPGTVVWLEPR